MAVIVSNGATNLSTVNGFYRSDAYNLSPKYLGLTLSSTRLIPVTFANAGNLLGVILTLKTSAQTLTNSAKSVQVDFQELILGVWTTRATQTLAPTAISNGTNISGSWVTPFTFAPTAVLTTAGIYRFSVICTGAGTNWSLATSDAGGTAPMFVTWSDTAVSYASGDIPVAKDVITIDQNATFTGITSTGEATHMVCALACKAPDPSVATVSMFEWENAPASSYTLNLDGYMIFSSHSGIRIGTEANPIPLAQKAIITLKRLPTNGNGTAGSGFMCANLQQNIGASRNSIFFYGEKDPKPMSKLDGDVANGATTLTVLDGTAFAIDDYFAIGRRTAPGYNETGRAKYKVTNVAGNVLTFTPALSGEAKSGGMVIKEKNDVTGSYYGIEVKRTVETVSNPNVFLTTSYPPANLVLNGTYFESAIMSSNGSAPVFEESANYIPFEIKDTTIHFQQHENTGAPIATQFFTNLCIPDAGFNIDGVYICGNCLFTTIKATVSTVGSTTISSGAVEMNNVYICGVWGSIFGMVSNTQPIIMNVNNLQLENYSTNAAYFVGTNSLWQNLNIWGGYWLGLGFYGGFFINSTVDTASFDNCGTGGTGFGQGAIQFDALCVNALFKNVSFGQQLANTYDVANGANIYYTAQIESNTGALNVSTVAQKSGITGSKVGVTTDNLVANADYTVYPYGRVTRTGYGLGDTTVWNGTAFDVASAGQFGARLDPNDGSNLVAYQDNSGVTTIGDCQGQTVTVTARVKIKNASFYAGTHTKPTLKVTYDGTTVVSSVATGTTDAQQLQVTFTPTTNAQAISIEVNCATDATGTNVQVYLGEILVSLPSGIVVDTSRFNNWTSGLPLGFTKTFPAPASAWDEPSSIHNIDGSYGKKVNDIKNETGLIPATL
jgi:hypothetical protein